MASLGFLRPSMVAQNFPGAPHFTEANVPDLAGKVYIVTGANAGVGKELARILYEKNATVYMLCRSEAKCTAAIEDIKKKAATTSTGTTTGRLEFIHLDLGDLASVKPAVDAFLARESQLHVLFNNAGVMLPPPSLTATAQGYDVQLGTNSIAPFLLTQLLTPTLKATASTTGMPTRVVWVASMAAELYSERHGLDTANLRGKTYVRAPTDPMTLYGNSKAATYLHSVEYARRHRADNIISVAANPGNLDSDLYRTADSGQQAGAGAGAAGGTTNACVGYVQRTSMNLFRRFMLHPSVYGAYTELFAGLSPDVTLAKSGAWIGPWGRFFPMRKDIADNGKPKAEGGRGGAESLWDWTMEQVKPFM